MNNTQESNLPKIGTPATRALNGIGIFRLEQVAKFTGDELLELHGFGPKAMRILRQSLADNGLSFRG